jgi:ATP-dependent Clp protease adaptor protein ClpS
LPEPRDPDLIRLVPKRDTEREHGVVTQTRPQTRPKDELKKPRLYKVVLHNDDYTTMEFVVWVLMSVFHHDEATATGIMLHVHKNGMGVAGVYTRDVAETRASKVEALARTHEFPLRCSVEEEEV